MEKEAKEAAAATKLQNAYRNKKAINELSTLSTLYAEKLKNNNFNPIIIGSIDEKKKPIINKRIPKIINLRPTEEQKYRQYLTYIKPQLDNMNIENPNKNIINAIKEAYSVDNSKEDLTNIQLPSYKYRNDAVLNDVEKYEKNNDNNLRNDEILQYIANKQIKNKAERKNKITNALKAGSEAYKKSKEENTAAKKIQRLYQSAKETPKKIKEEYLLLRKELQIHPEINTLTSERRATLRGPKVLALNIYNNSPKKKKNMKIEKTKQALIKGEKLPVGRPFNEVSVLKRRNSFKL